MYFLSEAYCYTYTPHKLQARSIILFSSTMNNVFIISLGLYILIGAVLLILDPFVEWDLRHDIKRMRGKSVSALFYTDEEKPIPTPITKIVMLVIIFSIIFITFWPVFLFIGLRRNGFSFMGWILKRQDSSLTFGTIGGAGILVCGDCNYSVKIISFLHGTNDCTTGYQCQSCGQFVQVNDSLSGLIEKGCQCGGNLSREEKLFCPKCRSKNVHYLMEYIT